MLSRVKNFEIYRLPDGKDYYSVRGGDGNYFLYPTEEPVPSPTFEITSDGQIREWWVNEDCYTPDQMIGTGRSLRIDKSNSLLPF